jgi:hypothetical protein
MDKINEDFYDIKDTAKSIVSAVSYVLHGESNPSNYLGGSIAQYSKNLVLTFPVLCDNTISPETASMISKANERNVTTMLQLLFSAMNIEANDGMKVLAQIHKNINTSMDVYDVMDKMNGIADRMADGSSKFFETVKGNYDRYSQCVTEMNNELKYSKAKSFPVNSLSENSLNRFIVQKMNNRVIIREAKDHLSKDEIKKVVDTVVKDISQMLSGTSPYDTSDKGYNDIYNQYFKSQDFNDKIDEIINQLGMNNIKITDNQRKQIENEVKKELENLNLTALTTKTNLDIAQNRVAKLVDTDVKKANELQPTVLQINYSERKDNGDIELRSFLAGVKSRLVAVDSTDIIERLIAKNKTKINFLNFIRATTGEIRFFRDFLLAIDQAKLDSKNAVKKGDAAAIWNCLANRAAKNNKNKLKRLGNDASAITVLVVSQETVNYMKSAYKFDLEKMNNTKMICDAYNLMGIMIADESIEVIKVFYVGNSNYERLAYSYMEKENSNSDYKKMVSLMGKMNTR